MYIPQERAQQIAGLNDTEIRNHTNGGTRIPIARSLSNPLLLWDGKFELPTPRKMNKRSIFQLVDSLGPDKLRLTYDGASLSEDNNAIQNSDWYSTISGKSLAKERKLPMEADLCGRTRLQSEPLSKDFLGLISSMYTSLSNAISQDLYGQHCRFWILLRFSNTGRIAMGLSAVLIFGWWSSLL